MGKSRKTNLGQVTAIIRSRRNGTANADAVNTGASQAGETPAGKATLPTGDFRSPAFRRRLVADFCKLLGDQLPTAHTTPTPRATAEPLPPRLQQTLELLLAGDSEKQVARKLAISPHTVHAYVKMLYRKFDVSSRGELLARWVKH